MFGTRWNASLPAEVVSVSVFIMFVLFFDPQFRKRGWTFTVQPVKVRRGMLRRRRQKGEGRRGHGGKCTRTWETPLPGPLPTPSSRREGIAPATQRRGVLECLGEEGAGERRQE